MTELKGFSLYEVVINWDADARIDKYRAGHNSGTMLFPATLQDHGSPIEVVVKVSIVSFGPLIQWQPKGSDCVSLQRG